MPRCFVTGCKSGYDCQRSAEKRHFFRAPRDSSRLQVWQRAIPRLDKQLTSSCVVCDLHFEDSDLVKEFVHNINGDVVIIPRDNWALKDDAVPRLFPNCPSYLSKPARKRKQPAVRRAPPVKDPRYALARQNCFQCSWLSHLVPRPSEQGGALCVANLARKACVAEQTSRELSPATVTLVPCLVDPFCT
ncbi:hypothetical protein HPB49_004078 [Dermacentor silvarum]|uniref:Uncharacterized protein n=1 Tax=Dermacentor silvarum TaxID=543639 RepID=A0ACB8D2U9_DERSI|nr:hypothetical protein HPB49_004078 [Dermacentor silvarum]